MASTGQSLPLSAGNITSFTDSGLAASTNYQYRVRAYNSNGNSAAIPTLGNCNNKLGNNSGCCHRHRRTDSQLSSIPPGALKVSGTVAINVTASDNIGVRSLKLYIDGKLVSSSSASSLSYSWNTRKASAGTHTISSQAADPSNNIGSKSDVGDQVDNSHNDQKADTKNAGH